MSLLSFLAGSAIGFLLALLLTFAVTRLYLLRPR